MIERECRVVLIGERGVGKTSIIKRFCENVFNENSNHTISVNCYKRTMNFKEKTLTFNVWDTPVPVDRGAVDVVFLDANVVFMIYSKDKESSFNEIKEYWYNRVMEKARTKPIVYIVKSKCDKNEKNEFTNEEMEFIAEKNLKFSLVSAKDNMKVDELFKTAGKEYMTINRL